MIIFINFNCVNIFNRLHTFIRKAQKGVKNPLKFIYKIRFKTLQSPVILGFYIVSILYTLYGGEMGIRTPETSLMVYTISSRAPSANSDTSPHLHEGNTIIKNSQAFSKISYLIIIDMKKHMWYHAI